MYMELERLASWFKTTITGIILLGALGSIIAAMLLRFIDRHLGPRVRAVSERWRRKHTPQAFLLGYTAAVMHKDESGRYMQTFMIYHLARFIAALFAFVLCVILFTVVLAAQARELLTGGTLALSIMSFLSLYWIHFEYEYIYRTYLWFWGSSIRSAKASYKDRHQKDGEDSEEKRTEGQKSLSETPAKLSQQSG